jgi:hypothetical protein
MKSKTAAVMLMATAMVVSAASMPRAAHAASAAPDAWTAPLQIPSAASPAGPALAAYGGLLYAAWEGNGSPYDVIFRTYSGSGWSGREYVGSPTATAEAFTGPGLAVYDSDLYAAWVGQTAPHDVYYSAYNGTNWTPNTYVPSSSTGGTEAGTAPALAAFDGDLYAAWLVTTNGTSYAVWYSKFNGTVWTTPISIPGITGEISGTPALAVYRGALYASWSDGDSEVAYAYLSAVGRRLTWSTPDFVDLSCSFELGGAGLAVANGTLYDAWINCASNYVNYSKFKGTTPESPGILSPQTEDLTCYAAALAAYGGSLYAAWSTGTGQCGGPGAGVVYASEP